MSGAAQDKTIVTGGIATVETADGKQYVWDLKRRPTINDVARLAEVSKKTVSRVINQSPLVNDETRQKIAKVIADIGYEPDPQARGLASQRSFLLGLIYDNPNAQYIVNIQSGVLEACRKSGFELVVHPCDRDSPHLLKEVRQFVERQKLDGVVLLPPVSENDALAAMLTEVGCRFIRLACVPLDIAANLIVYEDHKGAAEVADHLAELGHRRIGFIAGPSQYRSAHERHRGFANGLARHGLSLSPEMMAEGAYTFESGDVCAEKLLRQVPRPTAIFACNDEMAAGAYKAAYRMRIAIPEELSVVGYDDSPLASRLSPSLTTVRSPIRDMGRMAGERLIQRISQPDARMREVVIQPHLALRDSTAKPKS
ncbi:LacI family DNA-binding transcriptional regulator [Niveispirillum irakense]|uniref:LacI family DNA-binding transcriptional regulator n=1 Tax=Niveispirillum irakense TaxID=34011 RepID=UPI0004136B3F|nr:LacI family DNA-binding transcriptional regulator [Niveispirillum irakense]